ncbi:hypothetical protein ACH5RR_012445 [Cinchona calisaya]|uniref:Uncharacterized protein n=1 Tax=Cinchona calisaya TaxID=153742 RepID=A0ABD3A7R7_9GENT
MYKKTYLLGPRTSNDGVPKICEVPKTSERGTQVEEAGIVGHDVVKNYRLKSMVRKKKSTRKNGNGANINNDMQLEDVDEPINENGPETNTATQSEPEGDINGANQQQEFGVNDNAVASSSTHKRVQANKGTRKKKVKGSLMQKEKQVQENEESSSGESLHDSEYEFSDKDDILTSIEERRADWHDIAS